MFITTYSGWTLNPVGIWCDVLWIDIYYLSRKIRIQISIFMFSSSKILFKIQIHSLNLSNALYMLE